MSTGTRIPLDRAMQVVEYLQQLWPDLTLVGSCRRRSPDVGDIEFCTSLPTMVSRWRPEDDALFRAINARMGNPWRDPKASLFEPPAPEPELPDVIGSIEQGLRPGFLVASLSITPWAGITLRCQIHRHTPANRGWKLIQTTGPVEFGRLFLGRWKDRYGIPKGEKGRASIDGHLVTARGDVVPVATEEDAFLRCGMPWVDPEQREHYAGRFAGGLRQQEIAR
jgi:hypothetical protein